MPEVGSTTKVTGPHLNEISRCLLVGACEAILCRRYKHLLQPKTTKQNKNKITKQNKTATVLSRPL